MSDTAVLEPEVEETFEPEVDAEETGEINVNIVETGKKVHPYAFTAPAMVWFDVLTMITEEQSSSVRNAIAKNLSETYSGTFENDETEVTITPTAKNAAVVLDSLTKLGFETEITAYVATESNGKAPREAKGPKTGVCLFSGQPTKGGKFRPGYDMKLRGALLGIVENALDDTTAYPVGSGTARRKVTRPEAINELTTVHNWYTMDQIEARMAKANNTLEAEPEDNDESEDETADESE
jgi:hypothetical protein